MDEVERLSLAGRLDRLQTQMKAREQIEMIARIVRDASSEEHAVDALREVLGCSDVGARHVMSTPLSYYRRRQPDHLKQEIVELESTLKLA